MYADGGEFGQNRRVESAWVQISIKLDIGFLSWPKLSMPVQRVISCLLQLPLADRHIKPGARRTEKQAQKSPTSGRSEDEIANYKGGEESK